MHTPIAAFAWELWRRNRKRLIAIISLLLGFIVLYPRVCALAGFNLENPDALDEFAKTFPQTMDHSKMPLMVVRIVYYLLLVLGPILSMFVSFLCVIWMFTFVEFAVNKKNPMLFPARLFTLPVSTTFLFSWLFLGGVVSIAALYACWINLVPIPHLEIFWTYTKCGGWLTLLALSQGIVWALNAWPITRSILLVAVLTFFLGGAQLWGDGFNSPVILPTLFLLGAAAARVGLQKMRLGQWQGLTWKWPLPAMLSRTELRGPKRFKSPAQAQVWFEWRRVARGLCVFVAILALAPVVIHLIVYMAVGFKPLQGNTLVPFAGYLLAVPLFIHFCFSISPGRTDQSFVMSRPMTVGEMTMATLKSTAASAVVSCVVALAALSALPLLNLSWSAAQARALAPIWSVAITTGIAIVIGLVYMTWRIVAVALWSARFAGMPFMYVLALWAGTIFFIFGYNGVFPRFFQWLVASLLTLLICLIVLKLLLAFLTFRNGLKRGLIAPSAVISYVIVWIGIVAVSVTLVLLVYGPSGEWTLPLLLGVVLLAPLARIAAIPIMLARRRHE